MQELDVIIRDGSHERRINFPKLSEEEKSLVHRLFNQRANIDRFNFLKAMDFYKVEMTGKTVEVGFSNTVALTRHSTKGVETNQIRAGIFNNHRESGREGEGNYSAESIRVEQLVPNEDNNNPKDLIKDKSVVFKIYSPPKNGDDPPDFNDLKTEYQFAKRYYQKGVKLFFNPETEPFGFVMPEAKGISLYNYLSKKPNLSLEQRLDICIKIVDEFAIIHNEDGLEGFVHHDISTKNIFFDEANRVIKVIDFGSSEEKAEKFEKIRFPIGTLPYTAPETLYYVGADRIAKKTHPVYDLLAIDRYAIGVILLEIITGQFIDTKIDQFANTKFGFSKYVAEYQNLATKKPDYRRYYEDGDLIVYKFVLGTSPANFNQFFEYFKKMNNLDKDHAEAFDMISNALVNFGYRERQTLAEVKCLLSKFMIEKIGIVSKEEEQEDSVELSLVSETNKLSI